MIRVKDLDTRICDFYKTKKSNAQTFREFIRESERYYFKYEADLDNMSDYVLNKYIEFLNELRNK